jgi:hypothetical protein
MKEEIWKSHPTIAGYDISDQGRVKRTTSKKGARAGRILKQARHKAGYLTINIGGGPRLVHRLMLEAFVGPRDDMEARHLNDVKYDNRIENLAWGTHADNYADRVKNGGGNHGSRHGMAKLTEETVLAIRASKDPYEARAARFGVSKITIWRVVSREAWRHI